MIAVFDVLPPAFGSSALGPALATFVPVGCGEVVGLEDPVGLTDPFPDLASSLKAVTLVTLVDFPPPRLVGLDEIVGLDDAFPCFSSCFPALDSFNTLVCSCAATSPRITIIKTIAD